MLGKLIRDEFRAVNRLLVPIHGAMLLFSLLQFLLQFLYNTVYRAADASATDYSAGSWVLSIIFTLLLSLAVTSVYTVTYWYLRAVRFRNNLFTDEGYLMQTLPVSSSQLVGAKLIVSMIWTVLDGIFVVLCFCLLNFGHSFFTYLMEDLLNNLKDLSGYFQLPTALGLLLCLLLFLIQTAVGILLIYLCITIGHSFTHHKIIFSIAIYIGINVARSIFEFLIMQLIGMSNIFYLRSSNLLYFFFLHYDDVALPFLAAWSFGFLLNLLLAIGLFLVNAYWMQSHLNLE